MLRIPVGLWGVAWESSRHCRAAVLCMQTNEHWAVCDTCIHMIYSIRICSFEREREKSGILIINTEWQSCKGKRRREELPELVNVTERYVFSFRVLNNPLNRIPTLQIHTEKQKFKEGHKQREADSWTPLEIWTFDCMSSQLGQEQQTT